MWNSFEYRSNGWWKFCNVHWGDPVIYSAARNQTLKSTKISWRPSEQLGQCRGSVSRESRAFGKHAHCLSEMLNLCFSAHLSMTWRRTNVKGIFFPRGWIAYIIMIKATLFNSLPWTTECMAPVVLDLSLSHPSCHSSWWAVCLETAKGPQGEAMCSCKSRGAEESR